MTDKFDDGGPAYPTRIENPGPKEILGHAGDVVLPGTVSYYAGMSLHDAFLLAVVQGEIAASAGHSRPEPTHLVNYAFDVADAMIAERNKRRGEG